MNIVVLSNWILFRTNKKVVPDTVSRLRRINLV